MNPTDRFLFARCSRGYSLAELLVSLSVLAILLCVAIPNFVRLGDSMRLTAVANDLLAQLHLARSEAIKRNARAALCKSPDGVVCNTAGGWEQGWILFHDANNNGSREALEPVIRRMDALPADLRLRGNLHVARYVSFAGTGATKTTSGAFQAGTLTLCRQSAQPQEGRELVISAVGRLRIRRTMVASCP